MRRVIRLLLVLAVVLFVPAQTSAEDASSFGEMLDDVKELEANGNFDEALHRLDLARQVLVAEAGGLQVGALHNIAVLHDGLAAYRSVAYGCRPDFDATHDAVLRVLFQLEDVYHSPGRVLRGRRSRIRFDLEGRVASIGDLRIHYAPFSDRIDGIGEIEIDYVPFEEYPREIGPIRFRWVFDELREVGGVRVERP